ncbi:hypothetical protein [Rhizobium sp. R693]|uniref:hypothetical protein n=1 Tax=Rhizobium sp. R693 TaxID=1764276 RepID=UPI000B52BAF8|nr:hypothetical protein [Rhizobium sp. R693]OWV90397.1 hypothetical protein ATY79_28570 [Rhizobium sp. R693]
MKRANNRSLILFTTLLISSFLVTSFKSENGGREFLSLVTWQFATAVFAYGLLVIAEFRSGEDLTGLSNEKRAAGVLPFTLLVAAPAVIVVNCFVPYMATTCSDVRCAVFERIFGSLSEGFQPFYMLNFFFGLLLMPGVVHIARFLSKRIKGYRLRRRVEPRAPAARDVM